MKEKAYAIPAINAILHSRVAKALKSQFPVAQTVIDMGGTGRLQHFGPWEVTNANLKNGIDGCALPFEDSSFDVAVSVVTLEHVHNQTLFLEEALRVCRMGTVHLFPAGEWAEKTEALKTRVGHHHPCTVPPVFEGAVPSDTVAEHLLALATLYPKLNVPSLHQYLIEYADRPFNHLLVQEKP